MPKPFIVLVEDDAVISELLVFNLQNEGYQIKNFRDGKSLITALENDQDISVSLFILDIMLPGMDGFQICSHLRQTERFSWVPVLMLTARGSESDKVKGLETGADDYLTKPFGMREFMARVQVLNRRFNQISRLKQEFPNQTDKDDFIPDKASGEEYLTGAVLNDDLTRPGMICSHEITIDDVRHRVYKKNVEIEMTHREYELLKFLMIHRGVAYSRDDLLNYVWGYEYSGETRTVDVHIRQLRRKLENDDSNPVLIETVRGRGYRFCENNLDQ